MLGSTILHLTLLLPLLFSTVMGQCVMISRADLDSNKWTKQHQGLDYDPKHDIDSRHATYNNVFQAFDVPATGPAKAWKVVKGNNKDHYPAVFFQTSVLHQRDSINWQTDLSISAKIINNTYRWKHAFRVRYILKNNKAYNYWIETDNSCVAGGFGDEGAKLVPFFAGDIRKIELYMYNN